MVLQSANYPLGLCTIRDPSRALFVIPPKVVLASNADLFTKGIGYNRDVAIFVRDNGGADQLVAWKESGGYAGIYAPNAAFVHFVYSVAAGHGYDFRVKWKTHKPEPASVIIYAAAGERCSIVTDPPHC